MTATRGRQQEDAAVHAARAGANGRTQATQLRAATARWRASVRRLGQHSSTSEKGRKARQGADEHNPEQREEENDDGDDDDGDDDDDNDGGATARSPLVLPRQRSARTRLVPVPAATSSAITAPRRSAWWLSKRRSAAASWTHAMNEREASGLCVAHEHQRMRGVAASTRERLAQRLAREVGWSEAISTSDRPAMTLQDLLPGDGGDGARHRASSLETVPPSLPSPSQEPMPVTRTALLEIVVERLVVDDHASFTLSDRLEAQLGSLHASYLPLLRSMPWLAPLRRLYVFVEQAVPAVKSASVSVSPAWRREAMLDAERVLQELTMVQALHAQLLAKWRELQDCYRQQGSHGGKARIGVSVVSRAEPVLLTPLLAFLEWLEDNGQGVMDAEPLDRPRLKALMARLEKLQTHDECLRSVVRLERMITNGATTTSPTGSLRWWSCWPSAPSSPTFYVVLFVNDHEVGRTRASVAWSSGSNPIPADGSASACEIITCAEPLRLALHYLPRSVSVQVMERGLLMDSCLCSTRIPLLLPGVGCDAEDPTKSFADGDQRLMAQSLEPTREWYQFSGAHEIPRRAWHGSFLASSLWATTVRAPRRVHGRALVRVTWVPPPRAVDKLEPRHTNGHDHDQELPVLLLPPKLTGWAAHKSERYARLVGSAPPRHHEHRLDLTPRSVRVFRASSLALPRRPGVLTKRNRVLQYRSQHRLHHHHHDSSTAAHGGNVALALSQPVPLLERELLAHAALLALVRPEVDAWERQQHQQALARAEVDVAAHQDGQDPAVAEVALERLRRIHELHRHAFAARVMTATSGRHAAGQSMPSWRGDSPPTPSLAAIVQEQPMPLLPGTIDFASVSGCFARMCGGRRRRLRPQAVPRKPPVVRADWPHHCQLLVQVQDAENVPMREPMTHREAVASTTMSVVVEVTFQGQRRVTRRAMTSDARPVWMETMALPLQAAHDDWSPASLLHTPDVITFRLLEQRVVATSNEASVFRHEQRFLGSLEVPFAELYARGGTIDATLRCKVPRGRIGYVNANAKKDVKEEETTTTTTATRRRHDADQQGHSLVRRSREATFLNVRMTLDPVLPAAPVDTDDDKALDVDTLPINKPSVDSERAHGDIDGGAQRLAQYARQWSAKARAVNAATRRRSFRVFVPHLLDATDGAIESDTHQLAALVAPTFLLCFLCAQPPPPVLQSSCSVPLLVRFVALVPFLSDWQVLPMARSTATATAPLTTDLWTSSQQLLAMNAGDEEEHAVLLCNYLLWFDREDPKCTSCLVLGTGVLQRDVVLVLRRDALKRPVLWHASHGVAYSTQDPHGPLRDVCLVVTPHNVYANVQSAVLHASELDWDIEDNPRAWQPFFQPHGTTRSMASTKSKAVPRKTDFVLPCVQRRDLVYMETPPTLAAQAERMLREELTRAIRRWRSEQFTTSFNLALGLKLREALVAMEREAMLGKLPANEDDGDACVRRVERDVSKTHDLDGLPLQATFTDVSAILDKVQQTRLHENDHPEVQFALAVYVHGYPNCVLSVWVYLVSMTPLLL